MEANFKINANDLDINFLEALKKMFAGKDLEIDIYASNSKLEKKEDWNRKAEIDKRIEAVENGTAEILTLENEDFDKFFNENTSNENRRKMLKPKKLEVES